MIPKIDLLIASPFQSDLLAELQKRYQVVYLPEARKEDLKPIIQKFNALIVATKPGLDASVLSNAKRLKIIIRLGIGVDHIDLSFCKKRGIFVAITPNANISPVVELLFSQLIRVLRNLDEAEDSLYSGTFRSRLTLGHELSQKTFGVIGTGRIGSRVIQLAGAFGVKNILAYDPYLTEAEKKNCSPAKYVTLLDDLISNSDIITFHVPLTKETENMVDFSFLNKMKEGAILINTSRGKVMPMNTALNYAKFGKIKQFIIDVYDEEPYLPKNEEKEIMKKYFTLSPHIGAYTEESLYLRSKECIEELAEFFEERRLPHGNVELTKGY